MPLGPNVTLLRFLNREQGRAARRSRAALGWLATLLATGAPDLARAVAAEFRWGNHLTALRKAARHARQAWPRLPIPDDPLFDFTQGTNRTQRRVLRAELEKHRARRPATQHLTDLLYLQATDIHARLAQGEQAEQAIAQFHDLADQALARIEPAPHQRGSGTERHEPANNTPDFDEQQAAQALRDLAALLPSNRWPWFVISGTFLGLHREGGFLPHDYDIDLGIHAQGLDLMRLLKTLRSSKRFALKKLDHHLAVRRDGAGHRQLIKRPALIKLVHASGLPVDLFLHYTAAGRCWHGSFAHRWDNTVFECEPRTLAGVPVWAPQNPDRYLTENYGDWRIPVTAFDSTTGTPNMTVARNFSALAFFIKQYTHLAQHQPQQAARLARTLTQAGVLEAGPSPARLIGDISAPEWGHHTASGEQSAATDLPSAWQ